MTESFPLPLFDSATGTLMLPWWGAAVVAAFVVTAVVLSMLRGGAVLVIGGVAGIAILLLAATIAWIGSERIVARERAAERQALLNRGQGLAAQGALPGSALGCLDAAAGETVEAACERVLFGAPETVAAAAAYTAARVALLSDGIDYAVRANASYEGALPGLRHALEADRFGFVAQVLSSHHGCSAERCGAFALFRDSSRISANLAERTFDQLVARHAPTWQARPARPAIAGASPVPPGFNVPSAASIPPVSIMVPESSGGAQPSSGAPDAGGAPPPPRRTFQRPARPAQASPNAPVQLVPPAPSVAPAPLGNTGSAPRPQ
jgi:hypothetical protein